MKSLSLLPNRALGARWDGVELRLDVVRVAEPQHRPGRDFLDLGVLDGQLIEMPCLLVTFRPVLAAERDVIEADSELAKRVTLRSCARSVFAGSKPETWTSS